MGLGLELGLELGARLNTSLYPNIDKQKKLSLSYAASGVAVCLSRIVVGAGTAGAALAAAHLSCESEAAVGAAASADIVVVAVVFVVDNNDNPGADPSYVLAADAVVVPAYPVLPQVAR